MKVVVHVAHFSDPDDRYEFLDVTDVRVVRSMRVSIAGDLEIVRGRKVIAYFRCSEWSWYEVVDA